MTTVTTSDRRLFPRDAPGVALRKINDKTWRVSSERGALLGHVRASDVAGGTRFDAMRLLPRDAKVMPIGSFWSLDDAASSFRVD